MPKTDEQLSQELIALYNKIEKILSKFKLDKPARDILKCDIATLVLDSKIEAYKEFRVNS